MTKIPHNPNEILAVVDDNDNVIGKATRKEIHEKVLLHREVYIYILNSKKELLLQKRKDNGFWDISCAGHFPYNEDYKTAAIRELFEELGINIKEKELKFIGKEKLTISRSKKNNRFVEVFLLNKDILLSDLNIDYDEIEDVNYFNLDMLKKLMNDEYKITDTAKYLTEKYFLKYLD